MTRRHTGGGARYSRLRYKASLLDASGEHIRTVNSDTISDLRDALFSEPRADSMTVERRQRYGDYAHHGVYVLRSDGAVREVRNTGMLTDAIAERYWPRDPGRDSPEARGLIEFYERADAMAAPTYATLAALAESLPNTKRSNA